MVKFVDGVGIPEQEDLGLDEVGGGDCIHHYKGCQCSIFGACFGRHLCDDFRDREVI